MAICLCTLGGYLTCNNEPNAMPTAGLLSLLTLAMEANDSLVNRVLLQVKMTFTFTQPTDRLPFINITEYVCS